MKIVLRSFMTLLIFLSVAGNSLLFGQTAIDIPKNAKTLLQVVGTEFTSEKSRVTLVLNQVGFPPRPTPSTWSEWQKWPAVRMLETAYISAEAATPQAGGDEFLNKVIRLLAAEHIDAIRYAPELTHLFPEPTSAPITENRSTISFAVPSSEQLQKRLPSEARAKINIIARYIESVPRNWAFGRCCNLNEDEVYDLMRTSEFTVRN